MKKLFLFLFVVFLSLDVLSQNYTFQSSNYYVSKQSSIIRNIYDTVFTKEANKFDNAVYLELGGIGYLSLNYEMQFKSQDIISFSLGWNDLEVNELKGGDSNPFLLIHGMYLHIFGSGPSYFEIGIGASYGILDLRYFEYHTELKESESQHQINGMIGYRRQRNEGFLFRAGLTPMLTAGYIYPFIGLSFGYKFK